MRTFAPRTAMGDIPVGSSSLTVSREVGIGNLGEIRWDVAKNSVSQFDGLDLTEEQISQANQIIQGAVLNELARLNLAGKEIGVRLMDDGGTNGIRIKLSGTLSTALKSDRPYEQVIFYHRQNSDRRLCPSARYEKARGTTRSTGSIQG